MTGNFLPDIQPVVTHVTEDTCQCLVRDESVRATPEERVRQRVLHWLIHDKGGPKDKLWLEQSYNWVSDPARTRIRSDIELLGDGAVLMAVECKRGDVLLDERVDQQAIEYAVKARARWTWTTNGKRHGFFERHGSEWRPVTALKPLEVFSDPPVAKLEFPTSPDDRASIVRYRESFDAPRLLEPGADCEARRGRAARRPEIPPHGPHHNLTLELASLEFVHGPAPQFSPTRTVHHSGQILRRCFHGRPRVHETTSKGDMTTPSDTRLPLPVTRASMLAFAVVAALGSVPGVEAGPRGGVEIEGGEPIEVRALLSGTVMPSVSPLIETAIGLAIEDCGPIHGRRVAVEILDEKCSGEGGRAAAEAIVADAQVVGVIGTLCPGEAVEAAPVLSAAGLSMVSPTNTSPVPTSDLAGNAGPHHHKGYYHVTDNDLIEASVVAHFACDELGLRKVVTVHDVSVLTGIDGGGIG